MRSTILNSELCKATVFESKKKKGGNKNRFILKTANMHVLLCNSIISYSVVMEQ